MNSKKTTNKFTFIAIISTLLTACSPAEKTADSTNPQPKATINQAASIENSEGHLSEKYQAILDGFPVADPKLDQPINISDKKSATGLNDLEKLAKFISGPTNKESKELAQKFQKEIDKAQTSKSDIPSVELNGLIKELEAFAEKVKQDVNKLDLQDEEMKETADRIRLSTELSTQSMIYTLQNINFVKNIDETNVEGATFAKEAGQKALELRNKIDQNGKVISESFSKLSDKYLDTK
ncbi:MAG: hypothetical protein Q4A84_10275 [Neisseria sp.]|uniref:hypothetical protein n=1 Tax=Neisseria sp. TaxID=192066 RepID=UPI0026DC147F|nr:hypothetical protein [Neisseria sp.]MDO4642062.1 hypothetical protein [Neisseria sp.]